MYISVKSTLTEGGHAVFDLCSITSSQPQYVLITWLKDGNGLKTKFQLSWRCPEETRRSFLSGVESVWAFGVQIPPRRLAEEAFQARPDGRRPQGTHWKDYIFQKILGVHLEKVAEDTLAHTLNASTEVKTSHLETLFCFSCQLGNKRHMFGSVNTLRQPQLQTCC